MSYREALIDEPEIANIGTPFYAPFEILTLTKEEMAAERLRAIAQRLRTTDLAGLVWLLSVTRDSDDHIAEMAVEKFKLERLAAKTSSSESRAASLRWRNRTTMRSPCCSPRPLPTTTLWR